MQWRSTPALFEFLGRSVGDVAGFGLALGDNHRRSHDTHKNDEREALDNPAVTVAASAWWYLRSYLSRLGRSRRVPRVPRYRPGVAIGASWSTASVRTPPSAGGDPETALRNMPDRGLNHKRAAPRSRHRRVHHQATKGETERLLVPLEGLALGGGRCHDNPLQRAVPATRARKTRRRRATAPERTSTPCASSANVPPRLGRRPVRSHRWRGSSASGRSRRGVSREADIDGGRSRGDLGRGRRHP
jgi:hypothetical protein